MIEIENVSHHHGHQQVLHDITLTVPKGGVTALVGPNGAGKSTLLSLMARLQTLQSGRISFDGLDVSKTRGEELARKLAILRQDTQLGARLTVRDLVGFGRFPHCRGRMRGEDHAAVDEALAAFQLEALEHRFLDQLSGGQRQRAMVAMSFAQAADYLLLDEPLNNLDMAFARGLMHQLRTLADEHGRTIIVVIHEINYASAHADRIIGMRDGRLVAQGTPPEIMEADTLEAIFGTQLRVQEVEGKRMALHYA